MPVETSKEYVGSETLTQKPTLLMEGFNEMEADRSCVLLRGQNESLVNNTQPFMHRRGELREAY